MKNLLPVICLLFFCSCTITKSLWDKKYEDNIGQFVVSEDGNYVAFLGENFSYIFTDYNDQVKNIIFSNARSSMIIDPEQSKFLINKNNDVHAQVVFSASTFGMQPNEISALRAAGFSMGKGDQIFVKLSLQGKRYAAQQNARSYAISIKEQSRIEVHYDMKDVPALEKAGMVLITPFAVVADVLVVTVKILVFPLWAMK